MRWREPTAARPDPADSRLCLLSVTSCRRRVVLLSTAARASVAARPPSWDMSLDGRMLEGPHRDRPRLVELAGEEECAGAGGQRRSQYLAPHSSRRARPRVGRRAPPVGIAAVDRDRAYQQSGRLDVHCRRVRVRGLMGPISELQQPALFKCHTANQHRGRGCRHGELRMPDDQARPAASEPNEEACARPASDQSQMVLDQDLGDEFLVAGSGRVHDRLDRQPARPEPLRSTLVDPLGAAGSTRQQRRHAYSANSEWIRNDPLFSSLEINRFERSSSASRDAESVLVERRIAQPRGELAQNRGALKQRARVLVEPGQNLGAEVVSHKTIVSAERLDRRRWILDPPQPQPGEDKRSRPSFGAFDEQVDVLVRELETAEPDEQLVRVRGRECQVGPAQLDERASGAHPRELQWRVDACDEDEAGGRRKMG